MKYVAEYKVPQLSTANIAKGCFMPKDGNGKSYHAWYNGCGILCKNEVKREVAIDLGRFLKLKLERKQKTLLKELAEITKALEVAEDNPKWIKEYKVPIST